MTSLLLTLLGIYLFVGFLFAIVFVITGGPKKIDPGAVEGSKGFSLLIIPGSALFWPYLLKRWIKSEPLPTESSAHRFKS